MQVEIQPEIEAQLAAEARSRGLALDVYVIEKLREPRPEIAPRHPSVGQAIESKRALRTVGTDERGVGVDAMGAFAEKHGFTTGGETIKSMVHEGHKY